MSAATMDVTQVRKRDGVHSELMILSTDVISGQVPSRLLREKWPFDQKLQRRLAGMVSLLQSYFQLFGLLGKKIQS